MNPRGLCGERGWTRTIDPCLKRALLCQLSYAPNLYSQAPATAVEDAWVQMGPLISITLRCASLFTGISSLREHVQRYFAVRVSQGLLDRLHHSPSGALHTNAGTHASVRASQSQPASQRDGCALTSRWMTRAVGCRSFQPMQTRNLYSDCKGNVRASPARQQTTLRP